MGRATVQRDEQGDRLTETEASGGQKGVGLRWVLGIGLLLAIGALSAIWITGALTR